jgi:hypothetical protein
MVELLTRAGRWQLPAKVWGIQKKIPAVVVAETNDAVVIIHGGRQLTESWPEVRHDVVMDNSHRQYADGIMCIVYVFAFGVGFVEPYSQPVG